MIQILYDNTMKKPCATRDTRLRKSPRGCLRNSNFIAECSRGATRVPWVGNVHESRCHHYSGIHAALQHAVQICLFVFLLSASHSWIYVWIYAWI